MTIPFITYHKPAAWISATEIVYNMNEFSNLWYSFKHTVVCGKRHYVKQSACLISAKNLACKRSLLRGSLNCFSVYKVKHAEQYAFLKLVIWCLFLCVYLDSRNEARCSYWSVHWWYAGIRWTRRSSQSKWIWEASQGKEATYLSKKNCFLMKDQSK